MKNPLTSALLALVLLAVGCKDDGETDDSTATDDSAPEVDEDGDGSPAGEDCDDSEPLSFPGNPEVAYDGVDNDCDATTLDDDLDGDGHLAATDCDDNDGAVNPAATEVCDGVDNNCDTLTDDASATDATSWYADSDDDGWGDDATGLTSCEAPSGHVAQAGDCDDADANYNPGATETCDDTEDFNCDGSVGFTDNDQDGFAACRECDDDDANVNPDAAEVCDGVDNDCDNQTDDDDAGVTGTTAYYEDNDNDGYGDPNSTLDACVPPSGWVSDDTDCDDGDADVNPGEQDNNTNGVDDNCDGDIDEDAPTTSHATDIQPIWDANCSGCHTGGGSSGTLTLDNGYSTLVNVVSGQLRTMNRVTPGDSAQSYLWHKLNNTHLSAGGSGVQMPRGGPYLGASDLALIELWINEGAPQ